MSIDTITGGIMHIIGIDPGKAGAIVHMWDNGEIHELCKMPEEPREIAYLLHKFRANAVVYLEKAQVMTFGGARKQGVVGMFNYGHHNGMIEGMLIALSIPYVLVAPQSWTRLMHEGTTGDDPKARSLQAAQRLFPHVNLLRSERCKKPDEGFVDALLIAEYGRRKMLGG